MVAADALKKGLEIAYSLAPELQQRKILGDTIRIRQVLMKTLCWSPAQQSTQASVAVVHAALKGSRCRPDIIGYDCGATALQTKPRPLIRYAELVEADINTAALLVILIIRDGALMVSTNVQPELSGQR